MKKIILLLFPLVMTAQSQVHFSAGYKAAEIGYSLKNEDFLNFGLSISAADSKELEARANRNDTSRKIHEFHSNVIPAVFVNIGGTFDDFTITSKVGGAYINQSIQRMPEPKKLYLAVGIAMDYQINDRLGIIASFDNINSALAGITVNF